MLESGQLPYITTKGGLRRVDTMPMGADSKILLERMDEANVMLSALCKQFKTDI
jgi:hypothetical protein